MNRKTSRLLYWAPRLLSVLFVLHISLFAFEAFMLHLSFWRALLTFAWYLIPAAILAVLVALAWLRPWIGGAGFTAIGFLYAWYLSSRFGRFRWDYMAISGVPAFLIGVLFLANWLWRRELRQAR